MSPAPAEAVEGPIPDRLRRLRDLLSEERCDALLVVAKSASDPDLAPFVGGVHLGQACFLAPLGDAPRLAFFTPMEREEAARSGWEPVSPEELELDRLQREHPRAGALLGEVLLRLLRSSSLPGTRLAVAGHPAAGPLVEAMARLQAEGWTVVSGDELVRRLTQVKTADERAAIEHAAAGVGAAFRRVADLLAAARPRDGELWLSEERLRVARLRAEIALTLSGFELSQPEGNIVAAAEEGAVPHNQGDSGRVLRPGDSLVVDLYPRGRLFADCTRTFCVGDPPPALRAAHAAVTEALARAEAAALPGARGFALQEAACALLAEQGYRTAVTHPGTTTGYVHGLGHGVGYELHEYPTFRKNSGSEGVLGEGDVITLEPGLYDPEAGWAVRVEDLYAVAAGGPRNLTPLPRDLDPRAWRGR